MQDDRTEEPTARWSTAGGDSPAGTGTTSELDAGQGHADRNVLLAFLAYQNGFLEHRSLLEAIQDWIGDKSRPMEAILLGRGDLDADQLAALGPLLDQHLRLREGGDDGGFVLPDETATARAELSLVADSDVQTALLRVGSTRAAGSKDAEPGPVHPRQKPDRSGCRYRILKHHARGGLGEVYIALDEELKRKVALKEIQDRHVSSAQNRARFLLEGEVTGSLEHPGIVPVHGLGIYPDGRPYYAMKLIKGESLKQAIAAFRTRGDAGEKPADHAVGLRRLLGRFLDVCNAIEYAHSRGVLHRDLKPANIMLGKFGETLVVDWGLAKILGQAEGDEGGPPTADGDEPIHPSSSSGVEPTRMEAIYGTPQYMSPEQASGRIDLIAVPSDVYGLGATLYCLLTGRPPYPDDGLAKIKEALIRGDFPRPRSVDPTIAPALEAICLKAMAPEPGGRYPSAKSLAEDVEFWLADEPASAYRDPAVARMARWVRRHKTPVAAAVALLVASTIGLAAFGVVVSKERDKAERQRQLAVEANLRSDRQRQLAVEATQRSERTLGYARRAIESLMVGAADAQLHPMPQMQEFRGYLADSAVKVAADLVRPRPNDLASLATSAPIYHRAAVIHRMLSRHEQSADEFRLSIGQYEKLVAALPETRTHLDSLASVTLDHAEGRRMAGDLDGALKLYDQARQIAERLRDQAPSGTLHQLPLARSRYNKAEVLIDLGRFQEAGEAEGLAIDILDRRMKAYPTDDNARYLRTFPLRGRGIVARELNRPGAANDFELALAGLVELEANRKGGHDVDFLRATILAEQGLLLARDPAGAIEAERTHGQSIEILARLAREYDAIVFYRQGLAVALIHRATLLAGLGEGRKADAVADADRARKLLEGIVASHPRTGGVHGRLGESLGLLGRLQADPTEARRLLDLAVAEQEIEIAIKPERPRDREALEAHRRALRALPQASR